ncbi:MAG TPA: hypothetical protein VLM11_14490 [Streptosporangiaceae bacterium]|nr:hypothetical protein [Streptosporangiaceae bacterium]
MASEPLLTSLRATMSELDANPDIKLIVLTGDAVERRAHAQWHTGGIDREEVARRRAAVIERGRTQAG